MSAACAPIALEILVWLICVVTGAFGGCVVTLLVQRTRIGPESGNRFPDQPMRENDTGQKGEDI